VAFETNALLVSMAEYAIAIKSRKMYRYIANVANAEGVVMKSYEEAKAEAETDEDNT
jgi:hypothetical protein